MKVLMLTDYFPPHLGGGVEKAVFEVSKGLRGLGADVSVITLNTRNSRPFEYLDGVAVHRAHALEYTRLTGLQFTVSLGVLLSALRICRQVKPDIIHAHNLFFWTALVATVLKRLLGKPLVVTMHLGSMNHLGGVTGALVSLYEKTLAKWILQCSDRVIAVSQAVREHAVSLGIPRKKIVVIPNGVDFEKFGDSASNRNRAEIRKILFVGRLVFNKGLWYLVEAAPAVLSRHRVEFVIVGEGPARREAESRASSLGVQHAFKFLGLVPDINEILSASDLFVRPSLTDGMPLAVLEAMASGLPVVATHVGGTPEILADGVTGVLCQPGDASGLAAAILQLLDSPEMALRLGRNARQFVEHRYDWDAVSQRTLRVYEGVRKFTRH